MQDVRTFNYEKMRRLVLVFGDFHEGGKGVGILRLLGWLLRGSAWRGEGAGRMAELQSSVFSLCGR